MTAEASAGCQRHNATEKPYSYWREVLRRLLHNRSAQIGLIILGVLLFIAIHRSAALDL